MKKNILLVVFGLLTASFIFAQRPHQKDRPQPNPELKKEMQSYIEKNVIPVLQKAQAEFDSNLSSEDLTFIQAKRKAFKADREAHQAKMKTKMAERKANAPKARADRKAQFEKLKKMTEAEREAFWKERKEQRAARMTEYEKMVFAKKEKMEPVKNFIERHQDLIAATAESLQPQYQKWMTDQQNILKKYHPEMAERMAERGLPEVPHSLFGMTPHRKGPRSEMRRLGSQRMQKGDHPRRKGKKEHAENRKQREEKRAAMAQKKWATQFVLWDGTTPSAEMRNQFSNQTNALLNDEKVLLWQNYPNPAVSTTQIKLEIPTGVAELNLVVRNLQGKVVRRMNLSNLTEGTEVIELHVSDLPNGQYLYTIEGKNISESKQMTVSH